MVQFGGNNSCDHQGRRSRDPCASHSAFPMATGEPQTICSHTIFKKSPSPAQNRPATHVGAWRGCLPRYVGCIGKNWRRSSQGGLGRRAGKGWDLARAEGAGPGKRISDQTKLCHYETMAPSEWLYVARLVLRGGKALDHDHIFHTPLK